MSTRPNWPKAPRPAGAATAAPLPPEKPATMALALEAEAKALGLAIVKDLADALSLVSADAADLSALSVMSPEVRDMAEKIAAEARSRAASIRQLAGIKPDPLPTTEN